jgi:hypothetical protein
MSLLFAPFDVCLLLTRRWRCWRQRRLLLLLPLHVRKPFGFPGPVQSNDLSKIPLLSPRIFQNAFQVSDPFQQQQIV